MIVRVSVVPKVTDVSTTQFCGSPQIEGPDETHLKMTRTDYQKVGHT